MSQLELFPSVDRPEYRCAAGCGTQVNPIYGPAELCLCLECWDEWLKSDVNPHGADDWLFKKRLFWITTS